MTGDVSQGADAPLLFSGKSGSDGGNRCLALQTTLIIRRSGQRPLDSRVADQEAHFRKLERYWLKGKGPAIDEHGVIRSAENGGGMIEDTNTHAGAAGLGPLPDT